VKNNQMPFVTAKLAISLDGKIASRGSRPYQITSEACGRFTHERRLNSDAILTTARTILADNPKLNVRLGASTVSKPLYILDRSVCLSGSEQVFETCAPITCFHDQCMKPAIQTVQHIPIRTFENRLDLEEVIGHIGSQGVRTLWIEAGGKCFASFMRARLLHKCFIYIGAKTIGRDGISAFNCVGNLFTSPHRIEWHSFGPDVVCELTW
jgi:diaminohydroxyphosphoribosylaminopyrimidine deaminase/5-amino-6-(5-phosphoribosylamino)uracil reductase